ncbi:MAG: prepilin peptidase [Micavibrio sp.]
METAVAFFFYSSAFLAGICLGSFATALIHRIPLGLSWICDDRGGGARSACTHCGKKLGIADLVPLFSWLALRGHCRYCAAPIPARYPLVEAATGLAALAMAWAWGMDWALLPVLLAIPFMAAAIVIDWEHMILPDDINVAFSILAAAYLCLLAWGGAWEGGGAAITVLADHIGAAFVLTLLLYGCAAVIARWKGREALGMGDMKFLPAAGLFLGFAPLPSFLMLAGVLGVGTAFLKGGKEGDSAFPFGPALIISLYFHLFLTGLRFDYMW